MYEVNLWLIMMIVTKLVESLSRIGWKRPIAISSLNLAITHVRQNGWGILHHLVGPIPGQYHIQILLMRFTLA